MPAKGAYELAIQDFNNSLRLNPKDVEAYNNRCWACTVVGDLQSALKDCNEALRLRPNFVDALDSRGLLNSKSGQAKNAIADFDAALKINSRLTSSCTGAALRRGAMALSRRATWTSPTRRPWTLILSRNSRNTGHSDDYLFEFSPRVSCFETLGGPARLNKKWWVRRLMVRQLIHIMIATARTAQEGLAMFEISASRTLYRDAFGRMIGAALSFGIGVARAGDERLPNSRS